MFKNIKKKLHLIWYYNDHVKFFKETLSGLRKQFESQKQIVQRKSKEIENLNNETFKIQAEIISLQDEYYVKRQIENQNLHYNIRKNYSSYVKNIKTVLRMNYHPNKRNRNKKHHPILTFNN